MLGGWQLSSIVTFQSGGAFAVTVQGGAARVNTGSDQRPNRLRDANLPVPNAASSAGSIPTRMFLRRCIPLALKKPAL